MVVEVKDLGMKSGTFFWWRMRVAWRHVTCKGNAYGGNDLLPLSSIPLILDETSYQCWVPCLNHRCRAAEAHVSFVASGETQNIFNSHAETASRETQNGS